MRANRSTKRWRRTAANGHPHQEGDARDRGVARELRRTDLERESPLSVPAKTGSPPLLDREALSGDGSLVHGACTRDDHPVERQPLARLDADPCPHRDRIAPDLRRGSVVAEQVSRLGRQLEERPDRPAGTAEAPGLDGKERENRNATVAPRTTRRSRPPDHRDHHQQVDVGPRPT
jgi:hypothetical protein